MRRKRLKLSIYQKLILLFLLLLLPFVILNIISNQTASLRLQEQYTERMDIALEAEVEDYDAERFRIYTGIAMQTGLGNASFLANNYTSLSAYQLGQRVQDIYLELEKVANVSNLINEIIIFMPKINRAVTWQNYYDTQIQESEMERIRYYCDAPINYVRIHDAFRVYSMVPDTDQNIPLVVIEATISDAELLKKLNRGSSDESFAIIGQDVLLCEASEEDNLSAARELILNSSQPYGHFTLNNRLYSYRRMSLCSDYMVSYVPQSVMIEPLRSFRLFLYAMLLLTAVSSIFAYYYLSRAIKRPFERLIATFHEVENSSITSGPLPVHVPQDEFAMVFDQFNNMIKQIRDLIDQRVEQEKTLRMAEYKQMQAHIAPHFLYNSFNVLRHCILTGDMETAAHMARLMGSYFKYLTYKANQEKITLAEEYQHVNDYLEIQKIRFQKNITICVMPLPEEYKNLQVVPFILQPLVENVFKHGLNDIACGGEIQVVVERRANELNLIVRDNGFGVSVDQLAKLKKAMSDKSVQTEHSGLVNIHQRLQFFSGGRDRVEIDSQPGEYFEARISIYLSEGQDD